jgi:hypothetical protein
MITGVAKRMAAQFFTAVDNELTGAVVPIAAAPSAAEVAPVEGAPRVFAGAVAAPPALDLRQLTLGAVGGAALSLIGVAVGYVLGRRFTHWR